MSGRKQHDRASTLPTYQQAVSLPPTYEEAVQHFQQTPENQTNIFIQQNQVPGLQVFEIKLE